MTNSDKQETVDEAHTAQISLTEEAGGGTVTVMRDDGSVSIAHNEVMLEWPAPIAFLVGRLLIHMALQVDPSLKDSL